MDRLQKELKEMQQSPPTLCTAGPDKGKMREWKATIAGPPTSPYQGGLFQLSIVFPNEYPVKPPVVTFLTKIFHLNVAEDGFICLDILDPSKRWKSNISVGNILLSICSLMSKPNPDDPLNYVKAQLYKTDQIKYSQTAQEWTERYAK